MVVEWFPPEMNELSVTPQATTISISKYATKTFETYTKTVINFHRWGSSPPQHLYLDLHGTVSKTLFLFNSQSLLLIPNCFLLNATVLFIKDTGPFPAITLQIANEYTFNRLTSTKAIKKQKIDINLKMTNGVLKVCLISPKFKNEDFLILIEYRAP